MYNLVVPGMTKVWYLFYYFTKSSPDYITHQLMDFKADDEPQLNTFSEIALAAAKAIPIKFDYILRVLGSSELTAVQPNRVRDIALAVQKSVGGKYRPLLLSKIRATAQLKSMSAARRRKELEDVYKLSNEINMNDKNILIVDDIITTKTTFTVLAELITSKYPKAKIYGFGLAKTVNHAYDLDLVGITKNEERKEDAYKKILEKHTPKKDK